MKKLSPHEQSVAHTLAAIRSGEKISEREFDLIFPAEMRKLSRAEWTPLAAAFRAAQLLATRPTSRILDVGAGSGKLCIVGSLTTDAVFTGVELDGRLVQVARSIAQTYKLPRLKFIEGDALNLDWALFDGFYFFNPFVNLASSEGDFMAKVHRTEQKLQALTAGTRVVTYHGFGGKMPDGFRQELAEVVGPGVLQLWIKDAPYRATPIQRD